LERALRNYPSATITLVSDENFFLYTPLLHEVATGGVETRHIAYPIRRLRGKRKFDFVQGEVLDIDLAKREVIFEQAPWLHLEETASGVLHYDYLILALGGTTDTSQLPNLAENIFTLKNLRDGMVIRNHLIRMFELADTETDLKLQKQMLTFAVVGGGYTGIQLVAEIRSFIGRSLVKGYTNVDPAMVRVMLIEEKETILSGEEEELASVSLNILMRQGIEVHLNTPVTRAWDHAIELNHLGVESMETVIWTAGIVANPVVASLPVEKDEMGRVVVDQYQRIPGYSSVYALGDNARFTDSTTGTVVPPRAHYAVRQPKTAVSNIVRSIQDKPLKQYRYRPGVKLISLGPRTAAISIFGFHLSGFLIRIVWLIGYLGIMMGSYNRIRVVIDWFLALFFGRDSTLLSIKR
jgi:NADH dehydrogenase